MCSFCLWAKKEAWRGSHVTGIGVRVGDVAAPVLWSGRLPLLTSPARRRQRPGEIGGGDSGRQQKR